MVSYGRNVNLLATVIRREIDKLDSIVSMNEISGTNCWILMYIHKNEGNTYQKDIERHFGITRSTASKVISLMVDKDLVIRESLDNDQRLKKLTLTDKALELVNNVESDLLQFESRLTKGLKEDELVLFLDVLSKMESNLVGGER